MREYETERFCRRYGANPLSVIYLAFIRKGICADFCGSGAKQEDLQTAGADEFCIGLYAV